MCSIKFTWLYSSVQWKRGQCSSCVITVVFECLMLCRQSPNSRLSCRSHVGADSACSQRTRLRVDTDWNLWGWLLSQAFSWSLWVDQDQRWKWWQVSIYYNYRVVCPNYPFIGTREALGTAENIISILFPLPTTCLWSLCSLWPSRSSEAVSWPRERNVKWLTSQARLDTLRQHGPVT